MCASTIIPDHFIQEFNSSYYGMNVNAAIGPSIVPFIHSKLFHSFLEQFSVDLRLHPCTGNKKVPSKMARGIFYMQGILCHVHGKDQYFDK